MIYALEKLTSAACDVVKNKTLSSRYFADMMKTLAEMLPQGESIGELYKAAKAFS
jgi:archaellum biogenesis protein FlaJ (TadC family)